LQYKHESKKIIYPVEKTDQPLHEQHILIVLRVYPGQGFQVLPSLSCSAKRCAGSSLAQGNATGAKLLPVSACIFAFQGCGNFFRPDIHFRVEYRLLITTQYPKHGGMSNVITRNSSTISKIHPYKWQQTQTDVYA
jgi:hypothetical protein